MIMVYGTWDRSNGKFQHTFSLTHLRVPPVMSCEHAICSPSHDGFRREFGRGCHLSTVVYMYGTYIGLFNALATNLPLPLQRGLHVSGKSLAYTCPMACGYGDKPQGREACA